MFNQKEYTKKYHQEHKEKEKEYSRQYRKNNSEKRKQSVKRWNENNPEYYKQYYKNNLEKIKERSKQWYRDNGRSKEYIQKYNEDNLEKCNEYKKQHYRKKYKWLQEYKLAKGCSICGYNKCANALDFHHNGDKEFLINTSCGRSLKKMKEEMEKCILICANCHRELHAKEGDI